MEKPIAKDDKYKALCVELLEQLRLVIDDMHNIVRVYEGTVAYRPLKKCVNNSEVNYINLERRFYNLESYCYEKQKSLGHQTKTRKNLY